MLCREPVTRFWKMLPSIRKIVGKRFGNRSSIVSSYSSCMAGLEISQTNFGMFVHKASSTLHSIQVFSIHPEPVLLDGFFDASMNISVFVEIYQ